MGSFAHPSAMMPAVLVTFRQITGETFAAEGNFVTANMVSETHTLRQSSFFSLINSISSQYVSFFIFFSFQGR
jgi:hypothetical protein